MDDSWKGLRAASFCVLMFRRRVRHLANLSCTAGLQMVNLIFPRVRHLATLSVEVGHHVRHLATLSALCGAQVPQMANCSQKARSPNGEHDVFVSLAGFTWGRTQGGVKLCIMVCQGGRDKDHERLETKARRGGKVRLKVWREWWTAGLGQSEHRDRGCMLPKREKTKEGERERSLSSCT